MLLPFRNVSRGEPQAWLEAGAPLMLADGLTQFREITVVADERLLAARRRLGIPLDAAPDAAQLRRLAEETGGWTVVTGTVIATGGRLRLGAQALDAVSGNVLVRADVEVAADADVRPAFDQLAVRLLVAAGLPPQTSDLAAMTTRSIDAYRAFVRGYAFLQQTAYGRARESFQEAVRLDSTFALAWARLALAGSAWNLAEIVNPQGLTYRAMERAAANASRLPPLAAAKIAIMTAFWRGRLGTARALADSLARAEPEDLDAREFLALFEMLDPILDTTVTPPVMRGSFNRAVASAREVLDRDPGRRHVYSVFAYVYGMAGGVWWGAVQGVRREAPSFAAILMAPTEAWFVPVLRDSFELMPQAAFDSLPEAERLRLRRRAADAGMQWMQRWLAAGPGDADAHLWTSRMAELQGNWALALRENTLAESLGVESQMESMTGRRLVLLIRTNQVAAAGAMADSLAAAGALRRPFLAALDRGWAYGTAALLLTQRFARAGTLAAAIPGTAERPGCWALLSGLAPGTVTSLPDELAQAVADTLRRHAETVRSEPALRPCLAMVERVRPLRP